MKKSIRIEVLIEKEFSTGLRGEMNVNDSISTEYSWLLDYDKFLANYKQAIKMFKGFTMLTASLTIYNNGDYSYSNKNILSSFRVVNRYGEVTKSRFNGDSYNNFVESELKLIIPSIKEMIDKGNREFIEILKGNNQNN